MMRETEVQIGNSGSIWQKPGHFYFALTVRLICAADKI